jgi:hypothetical protein
MSLKHHCERCDCVTDGRVNTNSISVSDGTGTYIISWNVRPETDNRPKEQQRYAHDVCDSCALLLFERGAKNYLEAISFFPNQELPTPPPNETIRKGC